MTKSEHEQKVKDAIHEFRMACHAVSVGKTINLPMAKDVNVKSEIVIHLLSNPTPPVLIEDHWP